MKTCPVTIVCPRQLIREAVFALLKRPRFKVVSTAATFADAVEGFQTQQPDLVLCILSHGDDISGEIQSIRTLRHQVQAARIVLLTDPLEAEQLRDAAAAGIDAALSEDITSEVLQLSLGLVLLGQQLYPGQPNAPTSRPGASLIPFSRPMLASPSSGDGAPPADLPPKRPARASRAAPVDPRSTVLSEREQQIMQCLLAGAPNKAIARDLAITEATVKVHIKGLLRKIRVNNRTQAAVWGLNNPWVTPTEDCRAAS